MDQIYRSIATPKGIQKRKCENHILHVVLYIFTSPTKASMPLTEGFPETLHF